MSYYSGPTKEELFDLLVTKTRELGRLVTYEDMVNEPRMPVGANANSYPTHWGTFDKAAGEALSYARRHDEAGNEIELKGVMVLSKKGFKRLDPDREKTVMIELAELYVKEGGKLPPDRSIKKDRFIKAEEVEIIKRSGLFTEHKLEQYAVEHCGYVPKTKPKPVAASQPDPVVPIEPKNEPEVVTCCTATPVDEPEEEKEVEHMEEAKSRTAVRYTPEECERMLREECTKAGHVLSRKEVEALARQHVLPGWVTLDRQIGPWHEWNTLFGLDFKTARIAKMAEKERAKAKETAMKEHFESFKGLTNTLEEQPAEVSEETEEPTEAPEETVEESTEASEESAEESADDSAEESADDSASDLEVVSPEMLESDETVTELADESVGNGLQEVVIKMPPIKLMLPQGSSAASVHGTVTFNEITVTFNEITVKF